MTEAADKMVAEAGNRVFHDKVHAEARKRHLRDATMSGYDHHVVVVAAEHGARIALQSSRPVGGEAETVAWMYVKEGTIHTSSEREFGHLFLAEDGWTETPLYAHPAPSTVSADVVDAARAKEREEIVAWIRSGAGPYVEGYAEEYADAIASLQHKEAGHAD